MHSSVYTEEAASLNDRLQTCQWILACLYDQAVGAECCVYGQHEIGNLQQMQSTVHQLCPRLQCLVLLRDAVGELLSFCPQLCAIRPCRSSQLDKHRPFSVLTAQVAQGDLHAERSGGNVETGLT